MRIQRFTPSARLKKALWFIGLWGAGVLTLSVIAYAIRAALGL